MRRGTPREALRRRGRRRAWRPRAWRRRELVPARGARPRRRRRRSTARRAAARAGPATERSWSLNRPDVVIDPIGGERRERHVDDGSCRGRQIDGGFAPSVGPLEAPAPARFAVDAHLDLALVLGRPARDET